MGPITSSVGPDWKKQLQVLGKALQEVQPTFPGAEGLNHVTADVIGRLDKDLQGLNKQARFIFRTDSDDFTDQTIALLRGWHVGEAPSLAALCIFALEQMPLYLAPDMLQSILTAALLGEVENSLPYHNNLHFKKVLLQLLRLIPVHNDIYEGTSRSFDKQQIALLMIAACMHDLGHDGKGNTLKGIHYPGHIERRSAQAAAPYLQVAGLDDAALADVEVMLLTTDVSPLGDIGNYMNQMKAAYRFHFLGERKGLQSLNLDKDLAAIQKTPKLAMMSLILHEADISTSAGLSYEITKYETSIYGREIHEDHPRPSHIIEFLDTVCQQRMLSDAAQKLYAANMARIYALAGEDTGNGDLPFPKPERAPFITASTGVSSKTLN